MNNKAFVVVGLLYGDEFKGGAVDFLTRKFNSNLTVRFSGSSQCGHSVTDEKGNHHIFSQFCSGALAGARSLLSKYMTINPLNLEREEKVLSKLIDSPFKNLYIDENAVVVTPFHSVTNKLIELSKGKSKEGSCGQGCWETELDSINNPDTCLRIKDLQNRPLTLEKLHLTASRMLQRLKDNLITNVNLKDDAGAIFFLDLNQFIQDLTLKYAAFSVKVNIISTEQVNELINNSNSPVFESNQGICLSPTYGFFPYVTANSTTSENALKMLKDCNWKGEREVIGVTRTYATRHGAGPLVTEDNSLNSILSDKYNITNPWQDNFRFGWLDLNLLKYAIEVDGNIDSIAVSHIDELEKLDKWKVCFYYQDKDNKNLMWELAKIENTNINLQENLTKQILDSRPIYLEYSKDSILPLIEKTLGKKIKLKSFGPRSDQKEWIK